MKRKLLSKKYYWVLIPLLVLSGCVSVGNHEFDYGVPRMQELLPQIGTDIVCANLFEMGATKPMYQPYVIKQYGNKRIAFVGATTPESMTDEAYAFYKSTHGIDAVLDGHTHSVIKCDQVANLDNVMVPTTQTGTKFNNIGKLWISPEGKFVTTLVAKEDNPYTNDAITATTDSIKNLMNSVTSEKLATVDFDLPAMEGSAWLVRHQETAIGNLKRN